jgi:phosphate starvation-inducible PhoH-like protein
MNVLIAADVIKVIPLAYMRGLTFENKVVILDEAQNALPMQVKMFLTRIGQGSKYIISGDIEQSDRNGSGNGLEDAVDRLADLKPVAIHSFNYEDIVRHELISEILVRYN